MLTLNATRPLLASSRFGSGVWNRPRPTDWRSTARAVVRGSRGCFSLSREVERELCVLESDEELIRAV